MVFKRDGVVAGTEKWTFIRKPMGVETYYMYLGLIFSCTLKWVKCCKSLAPRAQKALDMF